MGKLVGVALLCPAAVCLRGQQIPAGTLFPVMLDDALDSGDSHPGKQVSAKLMQEVPLPDGSKVKRESKIFGKVVAASPANAGHNARISVQFDRIEIEKRSVAVNAGLRALASMEAVAAATQPTNANSGLGTSSWDWNMVLVGGQAAFNGQRTVKSQRGQVVGRIPEPGAVLAIPMANPARGCPAPVANTAEQAFWVFSTDACGVYGDKELTFTSGIGGTGPGRIVVTAPKKVVVRKGSGWLLQVNGP